MKGFETGLGEEATPMIGSRVSTPSLAATPVRLRRPCPSQIDTRRTQMSDPSSTVRDGTAGARRRVASFQSLRVAPTILLRLHDAPISQHPDTHELKLCKGSLSTNSLFRLQIETPGLDHDEGVSGGRRPL